MPNYTKEGIEARRKLYADPEFLALTHPEQRQVLTEWAARSQAPEAKPVAADAAQVSSARYNIAPQAKINLGPVPQGDRIPSRKPTPTPKAAYVSPQAPRSLGPVPQHPQRIDYSKPAPPVNPAATGEFGNAMLTGWDNLAATRPGTLPSGMTRPIDPRNMTVPIGGGDMELPTNPLAMLSGLPPLAEQMAAQTGATAFLGPIAGPAAVAGAMGGANYGDAVTAGAMDRGDAFRNTIADAGTNALMGPLARMVPGNALPQFAMRNAAQAALQTGADYAIKGIKPTAGSFITNAAMGAALDAGMGNMPTLDMPQLPSLVRRRAAQAGSAFADDSSFGGIFKRESPGVDDTTRRGQPGGSTADAYGTSPEAKAAWDAAGNPVPENAAPPPRPPVDPTTAPAAPPPPPRGPVTTTVVGGPTPNLPPHPTPPAAPAGFPDPKPTPEMGRVYGADANNLRGEARQVIKDVARVVDNQERPPADPAEVAEVRKIVDAAWSDRKGFIRGDKLSDLSPDAHEKLLDMAAQTVVEQGLNPKEVIGFDQVHQWAKDRVTPDVLRDLQPPKKGETIPSHIWRAASETIDANGPKIVELQTLINDAKHNGIDPASLEKMETALNVLESDTKRLLSVTIPTRSQYGRDLAYQRIVNKGTFNETYWQSRAMKAAGLQSIDGLPNSVRDKVRDLTIEGRKLHDAGDLAGADAVRIELAKTLAGLQKSTMLETVSAVIKAGLLTSPKTHLRNIGGNAAFQAAEEVARIPAALLDMLLASGGNGRRTISGGSIKALGRAAYEGATKGHAEARQIWANGATDKQLLKFDLPRDLNSGNKWVDKYTKFVFRSLSAEDAWFRTAATRRSLDDQALTIARNLAKEGKIAKADIRTEAARLSAKPDDLMMVEALAQADIATFQNDNSASKRWSAMQAQGKRDGDTFGNFALDMVVPFTKTPTNVIARMIDYTGGPGAVKVPIAVVKRMMGKLSPQEQRAASVAFGRGLVGLGVILLGRAAYRGGIATGLTTEEESGVRGANQLGDRPDGALRVGNRWLQLGGVAPLGGLFVLGATLEQEGSRQSLGGKQLSNMLAATTQIAMQNPMAQGAKNVLDAFKDPVGAGERWLTGLPSMAVPTVLSDIGNMTDDRQRQSFSKTAHPAANVARQIIAKVPVARWALPEKEDAFGRALPTNRASIIDPFNSKSATESTDPVAREIIRTQSEVMPPKAYADIPTKDGKERTNFSLGQQNDHKKRFGEIARPLIERYINAPTWAKRKPADQQFIIEKLLSASMQKLNAEIRVEVMRARKAAQ